MQFHKDKTPNSEKCESHGCANFTVGGSTRAGMGGGRQAGSSRLLHAGAEWLAAGIWIHLPDGETGHRAGEDAIDLWMSDFHMLSSQPHVLPCQPVLRCPSLGASRGFACGQHRAVPNPGWLPEKEAVWVFSETNGACLPAVVMLTMVLHPTMTHACIIWHCAKKPTCSQQILVSNDAKGNVTLKDGFHFKDPLCHLSRIPHTPL